MGIVGMDDKGDLAEVASSLELPCILFEASGSITILPYCFDGKEYAYFATIGSKKSSDLLALLL
jgi:hypothetical protein